MPRMNNDKTIQVSSELYARVRQLADKEAESLHLPSMSLAAYLGRLIAHEEGKK